MYECICNHLFLLVEYYYVMEMVKIMKYDSIGWTWRCFFFQMCLLTLRLRMIKINRAVCFWWYFSDGIYIVDKCNVIIFFNLFFFNLFFLLPPYPLKVLLSSCLCSWLNQVPPQEHWRNNYYNIIHDVEIENVI